MGWSSGTTVAIEVITSVKKHVKNKETRRALYEDLIETLESHDWDCVEEAEGYDPIMDEVIQEKYPRDDDD